MANLVFDFDLLTLTATQNYTYKMKLLDEYNLVKLPDLLCSGHKYKGCTINTDENNTVSSFMFNIAISRFYEGSTYTGKFRLNDKNIVINKDTTREQVEKLFGSPSEFFKDEVEENVIFLWKDLEMEFSWEIENEAKLIYISLINY